MCREQPREESVLCGEEPREESMLCGEEPREETSHCSRRAWWERVNCETLSFDLPCRERGGFPSPGCCLATSAITRSTGTDSFLSFV